MREHIFRPKRRVNGKVRVSRQWKGRYKLAGDLEATEVALHTAEKTIAAERLRAIVREKQNERCGIIAPKQLRDGAQRLLKDHLADFTSDLKALGRDAKYVYNVGQLVRRVFEECCWLHPKDVTADGFVTWRAVAAKTLAPKTLNEYLNSLNALLNWMKRHGRVLANPLLGVRKVETRGNEVRVRRALMDEEFGRLLSVAGSRKVVYLSAWLTGLRRAELEGLRWGDVHLDAVRPFIRVRGSTTKNHLAADLLLRDDLAAELCKVRPVDVAAAVPVFVQVPDMEAFRVDLAAAKIGESDAQGRRVDFHSLRHTFATNLSRGGVSPRLAMKLMRHSDLRLTMNVYTDPELLETDDALSRLARFDEVPAEVVQATGTYHNVAIHDTQKDTHTAVVRRPPVSTGVTTASGGSERNRQQKQQGRPSLAVPVTACPDAEKTPRSRLSS